MNNPYVWRGPVQVPAMFFDRVHELNEIAAFLQGNQSVSIVGPRKIGKTSLLFHLRRPETRPNLGLTADYLFVYLDCEVLADGSHEEIFGQFAAEMAVALDEQGLPAEPALEKAVAKPTRLDFETAVRRLNQRGLRLVLILDEFERLSTNPYLNVNFFNALRSAAGRYQLTFLTVSAQPLIQLTFSGKSKEILSSPFFNIFAQLFLGFMPENEARRLIREPMARVGTTLPVATEDFLYHFAGGHPFVLQVTCFHALETLDDLADIARRAARELEAHFQYYWHNLSPAEQAALTHLEEAVAQAGTDTTLINVLRQLLQKSLLLFEDGAYRYPSRVWADFVGLQQTVQTKKTPAAATAPAGLHLFALGPAKVYRSQRLLVPADWTFAKPKELLFYLLCHPPQTKEQIGLAFWPDASPEQLRGSFRSALYRLRQALGRPEWIVFENGRYSFNRSLDYWFDVEVFRTHVEQARRLQTTKPAQAIEHLQEAVKLYRGDFLEDIDGDEWAWSLREELRQQYMEALLSLGELLFAAGRSDEAAEIYREIIARDNLLEEAHRELMRCYIHMGERGRALRHYQTLVNLLADELGVPPEPETAALFERLRQGEAV